MNIYLNIKNLYDRYGNANYIGEDISQIEHAMQCAEHAYIKTKNKEIIVAALLHDIGHLLGLKNDADILSNKKGENLGALSHENVGADYLRNLGFSDMTIFLVENHVNAKRYLCAIDVKYCDKLSYGSKETLKLQGGIMLADEIKQFEEHAYFNNCLILRECDDNAKDVDAKINHEKYWNILKNYIIYL